LKKEHCEFLTPTNMAENGAQANRSGMWMLEKFPRKNAAVDIIVKERTGVYLMRTSYYTNVIIPSYRYESENMHYDLQV
jgi:hypothetical protein